MPPPNRPRSRTSWLVPIIVIAVAAALIAIILGLNREPQDAASPLPSGAGAPSGQETPSGDEQRAQPSRSPSGPAAQPQQPDLTAIELRDEADPLAVGPVDAPVALIVFSDYQCPFCARWSTETMPTMLEHVEAGDLRIEWRDVNVFGPASERAARATYAAALQGAFLEYHDALFAEGATRSEAQLSDEALTELAGELGLDVARFTSDFGSEQTAAQIAANQQFGVELGVTSTPVFILGGQPIAGAQPTIVFEDAFQSALRQAE